MLAASAVAGLLWDRFGAGSTFHAGAAFCVLTLVGPGAAAADPASRVRQGAAPRDALAQRRGAKRPPCGPSLRHAVCEVGRRQRAACPLRTPTAKTLEETS